MIPDTCAAERSNPFQPSQQNSSSAAHTARMRAEVREGRAAAPSISHSRCKKKIKRNTQRPWFTQLGTSQIQSRPPLLEKPWQSFPLRWLADESRGDKHAALGCPSNSLFNFLFLLRRRRFALTLWLSQYVNRMREQTMFMEMSFNACAAEEAR